MADSYLLQIRINRVGRLFTWIMIALGCMLVSSAINVTWTQCDPTFITNDEVESKCGLDYTPWSLYLLDASQIGVVVAVIGFVMTLVRSSILPWAKELDAKSA